jgi:hypothetical protein
MDSARQKKSCRECAKAKRRCTLGNPCQRCARQGRDCRYLGKRNDTSDETGGQYNLAHTEYATYSLLEHDADADVSNLGGGVMDEATGAMIEESMDLTLLSGASPAFEPRFSTTLLKSLLTGRLEYPIQVFKSAPAAFVYLNQTPWSHPLLWEDHMPGCLQGQCDALPS